VKRLLFVVPAAGRAQLAQICLGHLSETCDQLTAHGIQANAIVVANDENLKTARTLGFGTVKRDNTFVSRRFNDGIQLALDGQFNEQPADFVVPCGSDDWVDWRIFVNLPPRDTIRCFQRLSFVREDGLEITSRMLRNQGGCGIRVYPREVMAQRWFRPADEDRRRACDTSILHNLQRAFPAIRLQYVGIDPRQIVDWKSPDNQLNPYASLRAHRPLSPPVSDPFTHLRGIYGDDHLDRMAAHYEQARERDLVAA
jgi:hypothetical protein